MYDIILRKRGTEVVKIIKLVREVTGCDLAPAKSIVDNPPQVLLRNVKAERAKEILAKFANLGCIVELRELEQMASQAGECSIVLKSVGNEIIQTIKEVREATGLGLKEAKDMVEGAPIVILKNIEYELAKQLEERLIALGNTVEIIGGKIPVATETKTMTEDRISQPSGYMAGRCPKCGGVNTIDISEDFMTKFLSIFSSKKCGWKCLDCNNKW